MWTYDQEVSIYRNCERANIPQMWADMCGVPLKDMADIGYYACLDPLPDPLGLLGKQQLYSQEALDVTTSDLTFDEKMRQMRKGTGDVSIMYPLHWSVAHTLRENLKAQANAIKAQIEAKNPPVEREERDTSYRYVYAGEYERDLKKILDQHIRRVKNKFRRLPVEDKATIAPKFGVGLEILAALLMHNDEEDDYKEENEKMAAQLRSDNEQLESLSGRDEKVTKVKQFLNTMNMYRGDTVADVVYLDEEDRDFIARKRVGAFPIPMQEDSRPVGKDGYLVLKPKEDEEDPQNTPNEFDLAKFEKENPLWEEEDEEDEEEKIKPITGTGLNDDDFDVPPVWEEKVATAAATTTTSGEPSRTSQRDPFEVENPADDWYEDEEEPEEFGRALDDDEHDYVQNPFYTEEELVGPVDLEHMDMLEDPDEERVWYIKLDPEDTY